MSTANTEIYRAQEEDKAGKVIREIAGAAGHQVVFAKALPLDKKVLSRLCSVWQTDRRQT